MFCVVFLCCCPEFLYNKFSYKMLRNADMVGSGEVEYVRMGNGEYRNFMVENSERDYYAQTR